MTDLHKDEIDNITERYARRSATIPGDRYSYLNPAVYMAHQERERALIRGLSRMSCRVPLTEMRVLEIGCGSGANLLTLLRIGVAPGNLAGNELLLERAEAARQVMPPSVTIHHGNAADMDDPGGFDLIVQSTVFSSILSDELRQAVAESMWNQLKPGGEILWYDFTYDNPGNPDVRGVGLSEVRRLFPAADIRWERITLAPPVSRLITRVHPSLYTIFNLFPLLRTHILCWIEKKR